MIPEFSICKCMEASQDQLQFLTAPTLEISRCANEKCIFMTASLRPACTILESHIQSCHRVGRRLTARMSTDTFSECISRDIIASKTTHPQIRVAAKHFLLPAALPRAVAEFNAFRRLSSLFIRSKARAPSRAQAHSEDEFRRADGSDICLCISHVGRAADTHLPLSF